MLVSQEPTQVDVPHEPGEWIAIKRLSWRQLKSARKKAEEENRQVIKDFGPEFLRALQSPDGEEKARKLLKRQQYDESNFDSQEILKLGIFAWSYTNGDGTAVEVNDESIGMLDERTATWAKQQIVDLTRPPDEEEEKNSSGGSTDT
jgi:hypothetical protein